MGMASSIMDIFGALACGTMAFVLPSLCYYGVYGFDKKKHEILPMLILIVGCLIVICCPILEALSLANVISMEGELPPQPWREDARERAQDAEQDSELYFKKSQHPK